MEGVLIKRDQNSKINHKLCFPHDKFYDSNSSVNKDDGHNENNTDFIFIDNDQIKE